ncbi:MAG: ABC transporter ATP-binding protein [Phycisphaerales bacterium]|nr:ABC transporter ATP-binding protein [Phycisphaerales bacterium]
MIKCHDVNKSFKVGDRSVHALRGIDLSIVDPGFYAIMGRSGSGKSTLLHMLSAMDRPDSGVVEVSGHSVHSMSESEATMFRRKEIGVIFQAFNLIPTMTAAENVQLPGLLSGDLSKKTLDRSNELLEMLGLGDRSTHRPEALSGGEQQRVAIARALLYKPRVVFADEPTGNLDTSASKMVWSLLKEVAAEQSVTVVMVTHEPEAASYCEQIYVMADGKIVGNIDTNENEGAEGGMDAGTIATRTQHLLGATQ